MANRYKNNFGISAAFWTNKKMFCTYNKGTTLKLRIVAEMAPDLNGWGKYMCFTKKKVASSKKCMTFAETKK